MFRNSSRPMLFNLYNISLSGQYVSVLPPILLSLAISPETARRLRHPQEAEKVSAERADSTEDDNDDEARDGADADDIDAIIIESQELNPFFPTSPGELILSFIFLFPSIVFIMYLVSDKSKAGTNGAQEAQLIFYGILHSQGPIPLTKWVEYDATLPPVILVLPAPLSKRYHRKILLYAGI